MRKTKIVITVGPATDSLDKLKELIQSGVNVFRMNFSHATHEYHKTTMKKIRKVSKELKKEVAILQDISGPKIRICELKNPMELKVGDILRLSKTTLDEKKKTITLSYPQIIDTLRVNDDVYFSDGTIVTKVKTKKDDFVECEVIVAQTLSSKKGINFPSTKLNIDTITKKDEKDLEFGANNGVDIVALSFVSSKEDVLKARKILNKHGANPYIFSKIEKPEAIENLDSILSVSDGVMVARGDLGVELGVQKVPALQKLIIEKANKLAIPSIVATQMLTSMINSPYPTRAEVSDIANAVLDGADAVMLSDETTIGLYPKQTVEVLHETIIEAEKIYKFYDYKKTSHKSKAIFEAVSTLAQATSPDAIVTFTTTGNGALQMASYRPKERIIVSSFELKTLRKLQVVWGIESFYLSKKIDNEKKLLSKFLKKSIKKGDVSLSKEYIVTIGYPLNKIYPTNQIKLLDKHTMKFFLKK